MFKKVTTSKFYKFVSLFVAMSVVTLVVAQGAAAENGNGRGGKFFSEGTRGGKFGGVGDGTGSGKGKLGGGVSGGGKFGGGETGGKN